MRALLCAAALLLASCEPETKYRLADPACQPYVAQPGVPCREHLYLEEPRSSRQVFVLCKCYVVKVEAKP
jgi:hypothetical protein